MSAAHRDEIAKLESLYAENPEGRVFTHLAEAYRKAGEFDRAQEILSSGIERHPDYASAHVVLGRVLMDQGDGQEADAAFRRVLELDPHNLIAMRSRADIARERGDDEAAMDLYSRLLDQEPGDDQVREILDGMSQQGEADTQEPQEPVDAFTPDTREEDGGEDAELRTETIAQVYARQGLYDRAAEVYRELSRARPDDDSLRERLAEMEQLAEAQSGAPDEIDAVSDFDAPSAPTEAPWDESEWSEPDQAGDESPWSTSAPVEAEDESPWDQTPGRAYEPDDADTDDRHEEPEMGEMPAAGAYHDQWRTEDVAEPESEAGHPDTFRVEGLESSEVDPSEADPDQLADIEVDEMDPDTGLRAGATADAAAPQEDLSDEMDVRDVPEPPFEQPWEGAPGAEDEPGWLSGVGTPESDVSADAEEEAAESVWSGADWEGETDPETTPHAWTEEADDEVDASPPVRDYFGGLLGWSGAQPGREDDSAADRGEDDDDLDMFRSWLESLKQ